MGNQTTVTDVTIGGAIAVLIMWLVGFYEPELMAAAPVGVEGALALLGGAIVGWIKS